MQERTVAHDAAVLGDFVRIWCDGHHREAERRLAQTDAAVLGVYGRKRPVLCSECEAHLAYAEKRLAYCPHDPKPFCAHCETHCYRQDERSWQQQMMRYSGPRSWRDGHTIEGIKHMLAAAKHRKKTRQQGSIPGAAGTVPNQEESR
jgi:hypothetical protein